MESDVATERRRLEQSHYQKLSNKIKNNTKVILFFFLLLPLYVFLSEYYWPRNVYYNTYCVIVSQDYYHAHLYRRVICLKEQ